MNLDALITAECQKMAREIHDGATYENLEPWHQRKIRTAAQTVVLERIAAKRRKEQA